MGDIMRARLILMKCFNCGNEKLLRPRREGSYCKKCENLQGVYMEKKRNK